jgi:hypothetical protein
MKLIRVAYLAQCTLGWLTAGNLKLATIERPWILNPEGPGGMPRQSCVPDGDYRVIPHTSQRFPDTYALVSEESAVYYQPADKPVQHYGRVAILIHAGNRVRDVIGCIAVGMSHSIVQGEFWVLDSRIALANLRDELGRDRHHALEIRPTAGTSETAI